MAKIEDIIGQIPLVEDKLEQIDTIIARIGESDLPEAAALKAELVLVRKVLEELQDKYRVFEEKMPLAVFQDIDACVARFKDVHDGLINWENISQDLLKRAINPDKLARTLGYANAERMKAAISRDVIGTTNQSVSRFLDSWSEYSDKIRNFSPYKLAALLEDVAEENPDELRTDALKRLLDDRKEIEEYINNLTALSVLPECIVVFTMMVVVTLNGDFKALIQSIVKLDEDQKDLAADLKKAQEGKALLDKEIEALRSTKSEINGEIDALKGKQEEAERELRRVQDSVDEANEPEKPPKPKKGGKKEQPDNDGDWTDPNS